MDIYNALLKEGVIVRPVEMSGYLRISIGTFEENAHLIAALNKILC
jgi:histidinol-phosphate aminotransferase